MANSCYGQLLAKGVRPSLGRHETIVRMESKDSGDCPCGGSGARCRIFPFRTRRDDCERDRVVLDGVAVVGAGFFLFVWNFFSVPAALHTELSEKIAALDSTLAELKEPPLDYAAIRLIDRLTLREAAFYWCDLPVGRGMMPSNVATWSSALQSAVTKGELDFEPEYSGYRDREREYEHQKSRPHLHTVVKRTALQKFTKRHGYDPKFLRDA